MKVRAYLFFNGRANEAIEFYKSAVGAKLNVLMLYKDSPEPCPEGTSPEMMDKIMHAELAIGDTIISLSDGDCKSDPKFSNFSLTVIAESDAQAELIFNALSAKGSVVMPLGKTFFASSFGMLSDRFGVMWMVIKQARE